VSRTNGGRSGTPRCRWWVEVAGDGRPEEGRSAKLGPRRTAIRRRSTSPPVVILPEKGGGAGGGEGREGGEGEGGGGGGEEEWRGEGSGGGCWRWRRQTGESRVRGNGEDQEEKARWGGDTPLGEPRLPLPDVVWKGGSAAAEPDFEFGGGGVAGGRRNRIGVSSR